MGFAKPGCDVQSMEMPELPDLVAYITALESRLLGQRLIRVRVAKADDWKRLFVAARDTLRYWIARLRSEAGAVFPEKVTAFHQGMTGPWPLWAALPALW